MEESEYNTTDRKLQYFRSVWGYYLPDEARKYLNEIISNIENNEQSNFF